jgi:hypothetical protein
MAVMMQTLRALLPFGIFGCLVVCANSAQARPPYKKALAELLGPYLTPKLNDCRTCHLPEKPGDEADPLVIAEKPHNVFGKRLKAIKGELRAAGKKADIGSRVLAIADEDSDGDGVANIVELLTGHYPGEKDDTPSDAEVAEGRKKLAEFRKQLSAYPWTPFERVTRPDVPKGKNTAWVRNSIDAFIAAEHEARGLKPRPEASRAVLLRRVYLDLIGLPPTPEELHAFVHDAGPDAYEKVVDKLLASPRYGERWGRHWMDVWRYSDWAGWGNQVRDSQPHIWHWRDWIIESLNEDKGYDRMVLEMLAADELAPEDTNALRATGYLVRNFKLLSREKWMQDTVEHTSMAFLGVTLGCARCHDHMFDPILQREYYQVRAVFEPYNVRIDRIPGEPDPAKNGLPRVYDASPTVPTYLFVRGDDRTPDKTPLAPGVPDALGGTFGKIEPVALPRSAYAPDRRDFVVKETLGTSAANATRARLARGVARSQATGAVAGCMSDDVLWSSFNLAASQKQFRALVVAELDAELAAARDAALKLVLRLEDFEEQGRQDSPEWKQAATDAVRFQRRAALLEARRNVMVARHGDDPAAKEMAKKLGELEKALAKAEADSKLPESTAYTKRPLPAYPKTSTGRRLAFARWIADRDNPLTGRVAMNHIWLRHFGQAIVPSVFDFGRNGRPATHPALLDWLAVEFMEHGWGMKHMHKLIVTSATYRMASTPDDENLKVDADNKYLWRMPSRRLEAELVRDCVFYVAGKLDLTMGGPDLDQNQGTGVPRRSLYFRHAAEKQMEFLKLFDAATVTECYQRKESILPQQALALSNSELTLKNSRILARLLAAKAGDDAGAFVVVAYERVLSRPPTAKEKEECVNFLKEQTERLAATKAPSAPSDPDGKTPATDPALRARENLVHVLMNHNDFVTVR